MQYSLGLSHSVYTQVIWRQDELGNPVDGAAERDMDVRRSTL